MPIAAPAVDGDHRKRWQPGVDGLGQALLDAAGHHGGRITALPCNAITGRSALVWPGGRAIAQLVDIPPRAADTKEPVVMVGAGSAAGGGSRGVVGGANRT